MFCTLPSKGHIFALDISMHRIHQQQQHQSNQMDDAINKHERNMAGFIHLSTFTKYFFPFGNFIFPLLLWVLNKDKLPFVDSNGKQALNFQISLLLYSLVLGLISIPILLMAGWEFVEFTNFWQYNRHELDLNFSHLPGLGTNVIILMILGMLGIVLLLIDILCTIIATLRANEGKLYKYPLCIPFLT